jgi:Fur family transcriptional regulator, zinc uptake regulator
MAHDGHAHHAGGSDALARAEATCAAKGTRLTPLRKRVFAAVVAAKAPIGAYDIIDKLSEQDGTRAAPISIYRALDFLIEQSLVHRLASRNAFVACDHSHGADELVVFLLCDGCGSVSEVADGWVAAALRKAAAHVGFAPRQPTLEISGRCRACRTA